MQPSTGRDLTGQMVSFGKVFLDSLGEVDGFVLKSRSPSCGINDTKVHAEGDPSTPIGKGAGLFGAAVLERFPGAAVEDEGRLSNLQIRHHFLTKLFVLAAFRTVRRARVRAQLVQFHTANELILLAYRRASLRTLGRIVTNLDDRPIDHALTEYEHELARTLSHPARRQSHSNVLLHAMGHLSNRLSREEKAFFLDALEGYGEGREALTGPLAVMQAWIAQFDQTYLASQRYFAPYPRALGDLRDSGRRAGLQE